MAIVETYGLTKRYGKFPALSELTLSIEEGEIYGFIGPNGAGKTTTLRILATLLQPTAGTATVGGHDVVAEPYDVKRMLGFMPDSFGVYDGMRLTEYLDFFGAAFKIPRKRRKGIIADILELTDLTSKADDYVTTFSRGMKQRCGLAKTLLHDPKVLVLDEPASGLDPRARIEFRELMKTLREMGKTILISSHILSELGDVCDRIGIIEHGKLLASGDHRRILDSIRQTREVRVVVVSGGELAEAALREIPGAEDIQRSGNELQFHTRLARDELAGVLKTLMDRGVKVLFFEEDKGTLEDVFLHVTKGGL